MDNTYDPQRLGFLSPQDAAELRGLPEEFRLVINRLPDGYLKDRLTALNGRLDDLAPNVIDAVELQMRVAQWDIQRKNDEEAKQKAEAILAQKKANEESEEGQRERANMLKLPAALNESHANGLGEQPVEDLDIPAFLRRAQGKGYIGQPTVEATTSAGDER